MTRSAVISLMATLTMAITLSAMEALGQNDTLLIVLGGLPDDINRVDTLHPKAAKLAKKNLTYYWFGWGGFPFADIATQYGFEIHNVGCIVTHGMLRHNKRVIRKINRVYGENWFEETFRNPANFTK
jgi:hypothetical protein